MGHLLRATPHFRGKGRLTGHWLNDRSEEDERWRTLPGGAKLALRLSVPYEAMIWLRAEEETELVTLRRLLASGQTFVDCGANIGLWSLVASTALGSSGHIYCFEPNPATVTRLRENLARQATGPRVHVSSAAVGRTSSRQRLNPGAFHNLAHLEDATDETRPLVDVVALDEILDGAHVHGMKLDIEGSELDALVGAEATIRRFHPWICLEFNTLIAQAECLRDWETHAYLTELGYRPRLFADLLEAGAPALPDHWGPTGLSRYVNLGYSR